MKFYMFLRHMNSCHMNQEDAEENHAATDEVVKMEGFSQIPVREENAPDHSKWGEECDRGYLKMFNCHVEAEDRQKTGNESKTNEDRDEPERKIHEFACETLFDEGREEEKKEDRNPGSTEHDDFRGDVIEPFFEDDAHDAESNRGEDNEEITHLECDGIRKSPEGDDHNAEENDASAENSGFFERFVEKEKSEKIEEEHLRSTEELCIGDTRFLQSAQEEQE